MIMHWHEDQLCVHALNEPVAMFCLQVERNKGSTNKDRNAVELGAFLLRMPVFTHQDLQVSWQPYVIKAVVLHRSDMVSYGHYQAVLVDGQIMWLADDNCKPREYEFSLRDGNDTYFVWAVHQNLCDAEVPLPAQYCTASQERQETQSLRITMAPMFDA